MIGVLNYTNKSHKINGLKENKRMETLKASNPPINIWKLWKPLPLKYVKFTTKTDVITIRGVIRACFWFGGLLRWILILSIVLVIVRPFHRMGPFIYSLVRNTSEVPVSNMSSSLLMYSTWCSRYNRDASDVQNGRQRLPRFTSIPETPGVSTWNGIHQLTTLGYQIHVIPDGRLTTTIRTSMLQMTMTPCIGYLTSTTTWDV